MLQAEGVLNSRVLKNGALPAMNLCIEGYSQLWGEMDNGNFTLRQ